MPFIVLNSTLEDVVLDIMKYFVGFYHDQTSWSAHD